MSYFITAIQLLSICETSDKTLIKCGLCNRAIQILSETQWSDVSLLRWRNYMLLVLFNYVLCYFEYVIFPYIHLLWV
jgi:hypothetical protein